jgi:hypothetical protein
MPDKAIVGLADAVKALRSELIEAVTEGQDQWMRSPPGSTTTTTSAGTPPTACSAPLNPRRGRWSGSFSIVDTLDRFGQSAENPGRNWPIVVVGNRSVRRESSVRSVIQERTCD